MNDNNEPSMSRKFRKGQIIIVKLLGKIHLPEIEASSKPMEQRTIIGPWQLMVARYKKHLAGEQATHWYIQNKVTSSTQI